MGLFSKLLSRRARRKSAVKQRLLSDTNLQRRCTFETMEPRRMLSANPIVLGTVYIEEDFGSDLHGDRFEITFSGGAADTQLTRLVISGDQNGPGFTVGDVFFDTESTGLGADHPAGFMVEQLISSNPNARVDAHVEDGSSLLVLDFQGFRAGDRLIFSIDVDEVEYIDPAETDLEIINEGFDPITSGVEFQSSQLIATFTAPHYKEAEGNAVFWNRYDDALGASGLDLPADDAGGKRDRTTGAFIDVQQEMDPVSISGYVYADNSNNGLRDAGEPGLGGVTVQVIPVTTIEPQQIVTVTTNANGYYEALNLSPGTYRVVEAVQPSGYLDGLDAAGTVSGVVRGAAVNPGDSIENIFLGGGTHGIEYNFGEILPASLSGTVHLSNKFGDCFLVGGTTQPLADVTIHLLDPTGLVIAQTVTDAQGDYEFVGLAPGFYSVIEFTPAGLIDAGAVAGYVGSTTRGQVIDPNTIADIELRPGDEGRQYDFCEHLPSSIAGHVYHDRNDNGQREAGEEAISGTRVALVDQDGNQVGVVQTDANGYYEFTGLSAGTYRVVESQPAPWLDGQDTAGIVDGTASGTVTANDVISNIELLWGSVGSDYNFGELLPGSIQGVVHADVDRDYIFDPTEDPIANVKIELLDSGGAVIATTYTNAQGEYLFENITPGTYTVRETQPAGYYQGSQTAGSHGGDDSVADLISQIPVGSEQHLVHYDFCEVVPGSISGIVYVDPNKNERFEPGESLLENVAVQLLDANGNLLATTQTNADGYYEFLDLEPGQYSVHELQPVDYYHGGQQAGSHGGDDSLKDLIRAISIGAAENLVHYNFSELPPSTISGIVYVDPNQNEVLDAGETRLANVKVELLDDQGNVLGTTHTNGDGYYEFVDLAPGRYAVRETQPAGYFQGGQQAGSHGGNDSSADLIRAITIDAAEDLVQYNFSELPPSSISGIVYVDPNQNEVFESGESLLDGVTIELLSANGTVLRTTQTNANGYYEFLDLAPGQYAVRETQPVGYFHSGQQVGSHGGDASSADLIAAIAIGAGENLRQYNFSEIPPSSISGMVYVSTGACVVDPDRPISGVTIELLDSSGDVVGTTVTDAQGRYLFGGLRPGEYTVRESQPLKYFQGGQCVGSGAGNTLTDDLITEIQVLPGIDLVRYDFYEVPPASLSGYVFQDGPTIQTNDGELPEDLTSIRDGLRTPDDRPIAGVTLELRDGQTGQPILGQQTLSGSYPDGPIVAVTDANGFYAFHGLPSGSYAVYEVQPNNYLDGIDTPGSTGGVSFNISHEANGTYSSFLNGLISDLTEHPREDAIVQIPLMAGQSSRENNFSEVLVTRMVIPPVPPRPAPPIYETVVLVTPPAIPLPLSILDLPRTRPDYQLTGSSGELKMTWHLSVVNGGTPRGLDSDANALDGVWRTVSHLERSQWTSMVMNQGCWTLPNNMPHLTGGPQEGIVFGIPGAVPVSGDFNGDGLHEIGVYFEGQWFIDVNGNGRWDEEDLWAQLGTIEDLPVVGDWDGDGKDDIGIFGPEWSGDQRAIKAEPGLPGPQNQYQATVARARGKAAMSETDSTPKNLPPEDAEATDGRRVLKHTASGNPRMDVIDHVFRFGMSKDLPIAGDWNGDGIRSIGVFRNGTWYLDMDGDGRHTERDEIVTYGEEGDIPVVGDFSGDGIDQIGIYRRGIWITDSNGNRELDAHDEVFKMGDAESKPVVGDWDGDGTDDRALYRDAG